MSISKELLIGEVKEFYTTKNSTISPEIKNKYSGYVVNEIHHKLGWGDLSKSWFSKILYLFFFLTPKAAKITKAIRVYKVETYNALSTAIATEIDKMGQTKSRREIRNAMHERYPQFSKNEIDYIMTNLATCNVIMNKVSAADVSFDAKNNGWKEISTNVHKLACAGCIKDHKLTAPDYSRDDAVTHRETVIDYKAEYGETIGIKASSNWSTFIPFVCINENQWKGNLPVGSEFKYVISRKDGKIDWEHHANRTLENASVDAVKNASQGIYFK